MDPRLASNAVLSIAQPYALHVSWILSSLFAENHALWHVACSVDELMIGIEKDSRDFMEVKS